MLKGNGLCHGISGNGYLLHSLYRGCARLSEKDEKWIEIAEKWRSRAWMFAQAVGNEEVQNICKSHKDRTRVSVG